MALRIAVSASNSLGPGGHFSAQVPQPMQVETFTFLPFQDLTVNFPGVPLTPSTSL